MGLADRIFWTFPAVELALLRAGFHVACIDLTDLYGSPTAMLHMDALYRYLTTQLGLSSMPVLEGLSRGGLSALNWAARNPSSVGCIYLDAPACDPRSWPGGMGRGQGSAEDWRKCRIVYGLNDTSADFPPSPLDHLQPLAAAKIPIICCCGDADEIAPMDENASVLEQRYRQLGGAISVITKPGAGHHPHGLEDPAAIVRFILQHTAGA